MERLRPLGAIDADVAIAGRVVQVVSDRGSLGPRRVSVVIERVFEGDPRAGALTFRAPHEHGPGWRVGDRALFLLSRSEGGWHAAALAAESPRAGPGGLRALEAAWRRAREVARGGARDAAQAGRPSGGATRGPSISPAGLAGGAAFLAAAGWILRRRARR